MVAILTVQETLFFVLPRIEERESRFPKELSSRITVSAQGKAEPHNMLQLAVATAAAFNLICSGTLTYYNMNIPSHQFETTLRVDLQSGRWCDGECKSTKPLDGLSDTQIIFQGEDKDGCCIAETVNRESGEYLFRIRNVNLALLMTKIGTCHRAPFSGFPARLF